MLTTINHANLFQPNRPLKHIITDSSETIKLLEKECGYQKPWSLQDKQVNTDKDKQLIEKRYKKIDFYL